jgi:hypothetical protein
MNRLILVGLCALFITSVSHEAFAWGAVRGPGGGAAYRGPMGTTAVRGPGGGAAVRGPYGGAAARGPYGATAYRAPGAVGYGGAYRPYAGAAVAGAAVGVAATSYYRPPPVVACGYYPYPPCY